MRIFFLVILVLFVFLLSLLFLKFSIEFHYAEKKFEIKLKSGIIRFKIKSGKKKEKKPKKESGEEPQNQKDGYSEKLAGITEIYEKYKNPVISLLKYMSGRLELRRINIDLSYGTGDAAYTGILYGIIQIISGNLFAAAVKYLNADYPVLNVRPNFQNKCFKLGFSGIIKARPVHIIIAYLKFRSKFKNK